MKQFLLMALFIACAQANAQDAWYKTRLKEVPAIVPAKQEYDVTIKKQILHPVGHNTIFADAIKASFWVYDNDSVEWQNVRWAKIDGLRQEPVKTIEWPEFNGLKYKTKSTDFLNAGLYGDIPRQKKEWARMLAADAVIMQEIGWQVIDSLEFNKAFTPRLMDGNDIAFENSYTFSNQYLTYIWSGVTWHNNELCAVVKFESLFNPFNIDTIVKGRSMYYGELWVSMQDKQIEHSIMVEDVVFNEYNPDEKLFNMQRIVVFDKVK